MSTLFYQIRKLSDLSWIWLFCCNFKGTLTHVSTVHEKKRPFGCDHCNKKFVDRTHLKLHIKTHEQTFICAVCDSVFSENSELKDHISKYKCEICENQFTSKGGLQSHHLAVHGVEKPY